MTASTIRLIVRVPETLQRQAQAAATLRGETVSDVVRQALAEYIARAEEEDDARFVDAIRKEIADGAPTYSMEEVWAELDELEAANALPG